MLCLFFLVFCVVTLTFQQIQFRNFDLKINQQQKEYIQAQKRLDRKLTLLRGEIQENRYIFRANVSKNLFRRSSRNSGIDRVTSSKHISRGQKSGALVYAFQFKDFSDKEILRVGLCPESLSGSSKKRVLKKTSVTLIPSQQSFWAKAKSTPEFWIDTHDPKTEDVYISGNLHKTGVWDKFIFHMFEDILKGAPQLNDKVQLVVDVGANIGYFSLVAASKGFQVISFEPTHYNIEHFVNSIKRNRLERKITIYNNAVSNGHNWVVFKATSKQNAGNFQGHISDEAKRKKPLGTLGKDYAASVTMDDILNEDVLLMKIDVENHEAFVLDGAKHLFCNNIVQHVILEFGEIKYATEGMCSPTKLLDWMNKLGYIVSDVIPGASPLDIKNYKSFPPNLHFRLSDASQSPMQRLGYCPSLSI